MIPLALQPGVPLGSFDPSLAQPALGGAQLPAIPEMAPGTELQAGNRFSAPARTSHQKWHASAGQRTARRGGASQRRAGGLKQPGRSSCLQCAPM